ncbi:FtsW/RodA/SpoVE family cell cycle protein [Psychrobacillus sp. INOP01]|uniref:FtsW/RodA/SpoVE family cell cycle protein n=1 Tax=Psychrobacillus sp. INOP01 TaxID=2829187 RepID=UPI001BA93C10|nr:FtsW/RodA/SpoVE family cell cycle protein [Psychrobacillus sp. INOP01]QUG42708.1 FtsW/RodA/SpoVE family cell cycle protein [Psychrobacillus sp. INOP01]
MESFIQQVTKLIRSKEAKATVAEELKQHLTLAQTKYMEHGLPEEGAMKKAIQDMGSPVALGRSMNKIHKPKIDWLLIAAFSALLLCGFLPLEAPAYSKKIITILLGVGLVIVLYRYDYRKLIKHAKWIFVATIVVLLLLAYFPTNHINGKPELKLGAFRIDSLWTLPLLVIGWASYFTKKRPLLGGFALFAFISMLFMLQPHLIAFILHTMMFMVIFLCSKHTIKTKVITIVTSAIAGTTFIVFLLANAMPYQVARIFAFVNPDKDPEGFGYLYIRLQQLISEARWFGAIPFEGIPELHTDFVFAGIIRSYGLGPALFIAVLLFICIIRLLVIIQKVRDPFGRYLLTGSLTLFATQVVVNIGMIFGFLPIMAMSLPFISYGLMPTIIAAVMIGFGLSVWRLKSYVI